MERRVVITGLGCITPIGNNVEEFWKGIEETKCGIDKITSFDITDHKVSLAGEVKNFNPEDYIDRKEAKRMDRFTQFALVAAKEVMEDSKLKVEEIDATRFGVIVGSGIGGLITTETGSTILNEKGPARVSPFFIPMAISNMAAGNVSIEVGAKGQSFCLTTACASGTDSIGEAFRMIRHGYQDVIMAGGTEAPITPIAVSGFANMKALSTAEDKTRASIPFDKERNGFVMGEGCGLIMLEELEHAQKRGAKIYAEIVGYGASSDSFHITSPAPNGEGGARAMTLAMQDAKIKPEQITYINAHGTSTHLNDAGETSAVKIAFGEASKNVMMSSTKGNTGHLLGAAGGIEAIACIKAIEKGLVPPTIHYQVPDEECDLDVVPNEPRKADVKYAMSNSLGFGGHNGSIIFKKYEQ